MKRKKLIFSIITILIIFAIIFGMFRYFIFPNQNNKDYHTMQDVLEMAIDSIGEPVYKDKYLIEDKVTFVEHITVPKFEIINNKPKFNTNSTITLLSVGFKSIDNRSVYFYPNENISFEEGKKVSFSLPLKEYPSIENFKTEDDLWITIEPHFLLTVFDAYYNTQITVDEVNIVNISKTILIDHSSNYLQINISLDSVSNIYPLPIKWKNIFLRIDNNETNYISDYEAKVYGQNDNYLGKIGDNSSRLNKYIAGGHKIIISSSNLSEEALKSEFTIYIYGYSVREHIYHSNFYHVIDVFSITQSKPD